MPRQQAELELRAMLAALRHESFYESGTWADESLGIYVGWCERRSSSGHSMPLRDERGDAILVLSGEDFPEPGRGTAPSASLVRLYDEAPSFPAALNGRFHGLLVDRRQNTAILFNDRYGLQRLYYHESRDGFYFAAEAKAILAVRRELGQLDGRGLGELVSCGCVLEDRTVFDGIHVLPGAARWVLRDGVAAEKKAYFDPQEWESQPQLEPAAYEREMREVFRRNLPRYFTGREPIGVSLTGGLDTRMIMAERKPAPGSLPCYTFAGMFRDCQDAVVARRVAEACGQSHQILRLGGEFLARFPAYAERTVYLTDGCADVSRSADLYLNELARQIAPVRMTGNYGSEVLRRVRAFKPVALLPGLLSPELLGHVRRAEITYAGLLGGHPLSFAVFRQAPWHHYGLLALEQTQVAVRSPYLDNDLVRTVFRAPESARADDSLCLRLIADSDPALAQIPTDLGRREPGPVAAASHLWRQFQFKAEYAYDYGMPQWLARIDRLLAPLRPERLFLGRHKFAHFRVWYRGVLSSYVREVLLDPSTLSLPYVQPRHVEAMVEAHLDGSRNHTIEIHRLLTLALLHRRFARG